MDNLFLSNSIEVSEQENGDLLLDFTICDFNTNANDKKINRETAPNWIGSLVGQPLVGRISKIANTEQLDFTSHNKKVKYTVNDGKLSTKTILDTDAFGTFLSSEIKEINGIEYIVAQARMWSRFENAKNVVLNKIANNEPLFSSWEIRILDSTSSIDNGKAIDVINNGVFIGNCLLGRNPITGAIVNPAYKCAKVEDLQVAEEELDELSEALKKDIIAIQSEGESEEYKLNNKGGVEVADENKNPEVEVSSLTIGDIRQKLRKLVWDLEKEVDAWLYIDIIYPLENTAYLQLEGEKYIDEDFLKVVYSIDETTNEISIVSKEEVKMVFIPKETQVDVSELKNKLETIEVQLSTKLDDIVKLGETIKSNELVISEKDKAISELEVFKEQIEVIQKEQAEKAIAEQKENLKKVALSSNYITEDFIKENVALSEAIEKLDETAVKLIIAEEVIKVNSSRELEVSGEEVEVSTDLNASEEYEYKEDSKGSLIMNALLKNKKRR